MEVRKVLIIVNISKEESMSLAEEISDYLKKKNIETKMFSFDGFCENTSFEDYDFVVTLGGDGTVLYAARSCVQAGIPLFPVNFGQFGFLASVQPFEWKYKLDLFLQDNAPVTERSLLQVKVYRNDKVVYSAIGLNDAVISAKRAARTISLDVKYDSLPLCKLKSDGVIISSSTGSTAYSAAAGGPIVDPNLDVFVMTPVNSFSLSSRPIVLSPNGMLSITVEPSRTKDVSLTVDGQEPFSLENRDFVEVTKLEDKVKLVCCTTETFYNALRSKLNWSGGPHA